MSKVEMWSELSSVAPTDLVEPGLELHWAVQIIAAAGQSFAEAREDDSHRAMTWDASIRAFVGAPLAGSYPFRVSLRPGDLTLQLLERSNDALGSLPLAGQMLDDAYAWLASGLATYMGGAPPAIERPEYDLPSHPVASGARFTTGRSRERRALSSLYGASAALLDRLVSTRDDASEVVCWPHHFDIATLLTLDPSPDVTKTVGVGMAPMGGGYDTWYWYVTPWPYPDSADLPELGPFGHWHTEGWVGAVLDGAHVVSAPSEARQSMVEEFVDSAVEAAAASLSG